MISRRTKEALQAAKARGVKLGRQETADANRLAAAARDAALEPILQQLSHLSAQKVAAEFERRGLGKLSYRTVMRARVRLMTPPRGAGRTSVASVKRTSLTEMLTRQLRRPK